MGRHPHPRNRLKIAIAVVVLAVAGVAWGVHYVHARAERAVFLIASPDTIPDNPELVSYAMARGPSAYKSHCAVCHGADMKGAPFKGIPNLTDDDFLYGSGRVSQIERVVMYGIRSGNSKGWDLASMPAFGRERPYKRYTVASLDPQELYDIVSYIYAFQHPPQTMAEKESVARGEPHLPRLRERRLLGLPRQRRARGFRYRRAGSGRQDLALWRRFAEMDLQLDRLRS